MSTYLITTYKSLGGRSHQGNWCNTHEVILEAPITSGEVVAATQELIEFEQRLSHPSVNFMRAVIRDITDPGTGYDPAKVRIYDAGGVGLAPYGTEGSLLDLNLALAVKKFPGTGRSGFFYLRGGMTEGMVETDSRGNTVLTTDGKILADAQLTLGGAQFFAGGKVNVLFGRKQTSPGVFSEQHRQVVSLALIGAVVLKRNHKYFDRKDKVVAPA